MKTVETIYKVELTTAEIEMLHRALNEVVKVERSNLAEKTANNEYYNQEKLDNARTLRNAFASLVGTHYMGQDA